MIPVEINKEPEMPLSRSGHNKFIREVIHEFSIHFIPGSETLYVGGLGEKFSYFDEEKFNTLDLRFDSHRKMPDVVLYYPSKNWLVLVDSVISQGPVDTKRHEELAGLFAQSKAGLVYVTAFPTKKMMAKYLDVISWETDVWVAEAPNNLIHFDGERFLGPYEN